MNLFKLCKKRKMPTEEVPEHIEPSKINGKFNQQQLGISNNGERITIASPSSSWIIPNDISQRGSPISDPELITSTEVTIREPTSEESTSISGILRQCKKRILYPYLRLLGIMGLKPFGISYDPDSVTCVFIMNKMYIGGVTIFLLLGYVIQFLTCYRRDRGFLFSSEPPHSYRFADQAPSNVTAICDGNPYRAHLLPSLLHFGAFIYMVYLYRINEDEQLPNLMERVCIQASHAHSSFFSQRELLRTLQFMIVFSVSWVILSTGSQLLQITTHTFNINLWTSIRNDLKHVLICLMAGSGLWQDAIQVTVIVSYCIHCCLLSTYFNLIHSRVQQHSITLAECIKEIGELHKLLNYLNNDLAPALGPLLIMDTAFAVSSISFIFDKGIHLQTLDLVSLAMITILWILIVVLPMFESAKLSISCKKVCELGHLVRMRPFGYQNTPQADLDSFLLFVSTVKMNVNICRIPISAPVLSFIIATTMFVILIWGLAFV